MKRISFIFILAMVFALLIGCTRQTKPSDTSIPSGDSTMDEPKADETDPVSPEDELTVEYVPSEPYDDGLFHVSFLKPPLDPLFTTPPIDRGLMLVSPALVEWVPMENYDVVCSLDGSYSQIVRKDIYSATINDGKLYYFKLGSDSTGPSEGLFEYDLATEAERMVYSPDQNTSSLGLLQSCGDIVAWYEDPDFHATEYNDEGNEVAYLVSLKCYNTRTGSVFSNETWIPSPYNEPLIFDTAYAITLKDTDTFITSIIDFKTSKVLYQFQTKAPPNAMDFDGTYCAFAVPDDGFAVYDITTGKSIIKYSNIKGWTAGVLLKNGILVYGRGYSVYAIDLKTKERILDLRTAVSAANTNVCDYFFYPQVDSHDGTILFIRENHTLQCDEICVMTIE